ncbi:hypothetical protein A2U01_0013949, partial [Trifolium medium]|nr:hypothetical protein [Trifolium medium]
RHLECELLLDDRLVHLPDCSQGASRKKVVKHSGVGSLVACILPDPLVEDLPSVDRDCRRSMSTRTCIFPPLPLGGTRTEVDSLRKILQETTLREENVVERLRASEFQVCCLQGCYEKVARLEKELKNANEKAVQLEEENATLTSSLKECVGRVLDLVPAIFKNALDQVELYLGKFLPRDSFASFSLLYLVVKSWEAYPAKEASLSFPQGLPLVRCGFHGN